MKTIYARMLSTVLLCFMVVLPAQAQEDPAANANALFQAQQWAEAETAYEALAVAEPENGLYWFRLGTARHSLEQFKPAADAWARAEAAGFAPIFTQYNLASATARMGEIDAAFSWLEKALASGFNRPQTLETDDDLAALRGDPRFKDLVTQADRNARPCHYDERYRQFDFWVGTWDVFSPQGAQLGTNTIDNILLSCVLQENWSSGGGGGGKSFNYFDPSEGKWKQLWVDAAGGHMNFTGEFRDGAMRFEGININANGTTTLMRMTFTPLEDGSVRQFFEQSTDDGATWATWFDGYYRKK